MLTKISKRQIINIVVGNVAYLAKSHGWSRESIQEFGLDRPLKTFGLRAVDLSRLENGLTEEIAMNLEAVGFVCPFLSLVESINYIVLLVEQSLQRLQIDVIDDL